MRYIGVDLHKNRFTAYHTVNGQYRNYGTNDIGIASFIEECKRTDGTGAIVVGVESTGNTRYFKRQLEEAGIQVKVINTMRFKVVTESVKKTDKHDAQTIAEFLEKDMLPEAWICSDYSEMLRRLLHVRRQLVKAIVTTKNQVHSILTAYGYADARATLQSKRGRHAVLDTLASTEIGLVVHLLMEMIDSLHEKVKQIEGKIEELVKGDKAIELLQTMPGCGRIIAWMIRAYTDDIRRFMSAKHYAAFVGVVPYVHNSNATIRHGNITKHGPEPLRTAFVQLVMGMRRIKQVQDYRLMKRYKALQETKGSGKAIIATARKLTHIVWHMLTYNEPFDASLQMVIGYENNRSMQEKQLA